MPCDHCLDNIKHDEAYLVLARRAGTDLLMPTTDLLTPTHVRGITESANVPRTFLKREAYLIRCSAHDRIRVCGTGRTVAPAWAETAYHTFRDPRVSYIPIRSASNNVTSVPSTRRDAQNAR